MNLKETARKLKQQIPAVFLALKNPNTPILAKIMAMLTVGYALSPIDLIPDFIPVLGYLDDVLILPLMVAVTIKLIPQDIWKVSEESSAELWKDGKPKKWYYAIPIVLIWFLILMWIIKVLVKE